MMSEENPFMDVESVATKVLGEELMVNEYHEKSDVNDRVIEVTSYFVKEKKAIMFYIQELIRHAAKLEDINVEKLIPANDNKEFTIKNRTENTRVRSRIGQQILPKYQELPTCLDPILEEMISPIMSFLQIYVKKACVNKSYEISYEVKSLFEVICQLCNVRGYKNIVKFFPHEVCDMEPVVEVLQHQDVIEWAAPYVMVLWLSIIVLVPFDLKTIDSSSGQSQDILVKRIINIGKAYTNNSGKIREGAAILLAKLLTRPDVVKTGETDLALNELAIEFQSAKDDANAMFKVSGILQTFVEIFKTGHRDDLLQRVNTVFDPILKSEIKNKFMNKSTHLRKAKVNLAQRIGMIFLKPKVAKWRYQRGVRSLAQNLTLASNSEENKQANVDVEMDEDEDEEEDFNFDQLEDIIQLLLDSLKDEDNVVRWTAAKGIGRITMRLSKDFADQIVEQVQEVFDEATESAWHGGCLALAELCRRGLLLPNRLANFVPILEKALVFDINLGNHSVGAGVRDAACYVVWSFARAYTPDIMKPHVHTLSNMLIIESLFDREVNCRRAASATFQECVGRQGNFPHGIEILTEADYFTLSNRVNAYLNVSCFIGQYKEYLPSMLKHLTFTKLQHWEASTRELASQSISVLCVFNPALVVKEVLIPLIEKCSNKVLHIRHGAILGVAEIIIGLSGGSVVNRNQAIEKAFKSLSLKERNIIQDSDNKTAFQKYYDEVSTKNYLDECIPAGESIRNDVISIIAKIEQARLDKGKGGEIMRTGICHLIHAISVANIQVDDQTKQSLFKSLEENFRHPNLEIQIEATKAFKSFCNSYYGNSQQIEEDKGFMIEQMHKLYKRSSIDDNQAMTRGFNMAFGVLSHALLQKLNVELIETLLTNCLPRGKQSDDAETRQYAFKSLQQVVKSLTVGEIDPSQLKDILETFFKGHNDYAIDRRGDVGSFVRQEAMVCLIQFIKTVIEQDNQDVIKSLGADQPELYQRVICTLLQQLMEKIDRVREIAGKQLQEFFTVICQKVCEFSEKDKLAALFIYDEETFQPWRQGDFVFQQMIPFFDSEVYSPYIFKGLITSSGGLTESTLKASSKTLFNYLSKMKGDVEKKTIFLNKLNIIFKENPKDDRVSIPLMKTIELLLTTDYLSEEGLAPKLMEIHTSCVSECNKSKNIVKLLASIGVFAGMLMFEDQEICQKAVRSLLFLLYHTFPKVRTLTAEKLYTGLLSMESAEHIIPGGEDSYDQIIELLSETDWKQPVKTISSTKTEVYGCFGMVPKASTVAAKKQQPESEPKQSNPDGSEQIIT